LPGKSPLAEAVAEETENYLSDEEAEQDFEEPKTLEGRPPLTHSQSLPLPGNNIMSLSTNSRRETMSTIRSYRRARLAEKLRDVFELEGIKEVWAG
jgi:sterol 3beta-glucosyltransferase